MNETCNKLVFYERPPDFCLSKDMKFGQANLITITIYFILFILSLFCNVTMAMYIYLNKAKRKARIHKFMFHLNMADLLTTFITIPLEIGWKYTVYWNAGNYACKFFQFFRPLGIYLASFLIVSLCIDRYYAIFLPLKIDSISRTKLLITSSYVLAVVCSIPQIFVFSLKVHPVHKWYTQCLDFKFNLDPIENPDLLRLYEILFLSYQIFVAIITFFLPLIVIVFTHGSIIFRIVSHSNKKTKTNPDNRLSEDLLSSELRKATIKRAKTQTLKLVFVIVLVFLICWTPYYTISVLFWINPTAAMKIDDRVYNFLFIFAVSNCLGNPLAYGSSSFNFKCKDKKSAKNGRKI